ncbi:DUF2946 family protein [Mitsuaria sp. GD03876]|uniref:DUF2946 family protein n=1 Tax=Mitsuaria sp. GD03876 TaxID=2975399 RepID=UPI002449EDF5|nr:DUF2946 family protein [Mitsuaria sp. GD03876]MDH0866976.1 hypothetical protein [Mitsuaria sp. GD03876]
MRKHLLHLLLPLFMLLSQQGAVWHGIGHLTDAQGRGHAPAGATVAQAATAHGDGQTHADPDELSADQLCELCLAFDDLAASARSEPPVLALASAAHVQAPVVEHGSRSQPAPQPRSRGPPLVL